jgi:hypothetical protein
LPPETATKATIAAEAGRADHCHRIGRVGLLKQRERRLSAPTRLARSIGATQHTRLRNVTAQLDYSKTPLFGPRVRHVLDKAAAG